MQGGTINGKTKLFGIIGNPVSHSFSPAMHTAAFQAIGWNAVYLPFPVSEGFLPDLFPSLKELKISGLNVTVPYKEAIMPFLDVVSEEAKLIQAVNTIVFKEGKWHGFNTDGLGFVRSLEEKKIPLKKSEVLILGAGGSSKSISYSLLKAGVDRLFIWNRTQSKADILVSELSRLFPYVNIQVRHPSEIEQVGLLINTTSAGMDGSSLPVEDVSLIERCSSVADIIYNPSKTRLLLEAEKRKIPFLNGLGMLLHQGTAAFEIFTNESAPVEVMRNSLLDSLHVLLNVK